jgi:nucleoside-diphosphate-sugar epimerase
MRIHVTGGGGFLGRWTVPALTASHEVEVSDIASLDVTDADACVRAFVASRPDLVLHLAALCGAKPSVEDPRRFFAVNAQGTVNLLEACRRAGVKRFLFTSSLTIFGEGETERSENSPFAPRHPYAAAKAGAEYAVRQYARQYGLAALILRPTLVVGEGYKEPHAIGDFVQTALRGGVIEIFGSGDHRRDFVHPADVAAATVRAVDWLAAAPPGALESLNVSNGEAPAMRELADTVVAALGRGAIRFVPATNQSFSLFTSIRRAREFLGWSPSIPNAEIVRRLAAQGVP